MSKDDGLKNKVDLIDDYTPAVTEEAEEVVRGEAIKLSNIEVEDTSLLLRKIDQQIAQKGHNTSSQPMESFSKMLSLATRGEMCMFVCGHFFAAITGCAIPTTLLLLGESFNKFGPGATSDDLLALIKNIVGVMCAIAVGAWITMYLAWMLLSAFGTMVTYRIKQKYLAAILAQECAWFDQTNITELSAKLSRESAAINRAIGEKAGQVTFALALCFSGLVVGLT